MKKENSTKLKYAIVLSVVLIAGLSLIGYYSEKQQQNNQGTVTLIIKSLGSTKTERFKFRGGFPLGILRYNHTVKTNLNDNFIECIDDVCTDGNYWWLFYVNNKTVNYGVKKYKIQDGDVIMFEFTRRNTGERL